MFTDRVAAYGGVDHIDVNGAGSVLNVADTIHAPSATVN